jgi:molybdopterin/thiamine biosynthesis adenylyltransferase
MVLARAGAHTIGAIGIVDPGAVELSNLARQVIYRATDIATPKVEAAARRLAQMGAGIEVEPYRFALEPSNAERLIGAYDFVIDATDSPAAKFLINDTCVAIERPFVYGGVLGLKGQALTVVPAKTACLRCLFEEPPDETEIASCRDAGIVGPIAAVIGELQAAEAIAWLRDRRSRLAGKILSYDGASGRIRIAPIEPRRGCRCGAWREASERATAQSP